MEEKELVGKCNKEASKYPIALEIKCVIGELYFRIEELESVIKNMDRTHNKEIRALDIMIRKIMPKILTVREMERLMITISEDNL